MPVTTRDRHKIGTIEYECSIGKMNDTCVETEYSKRFKTAREAEHYGMIEVRRHNAEKDGFNWDARVQRMRWVADNYTDDEYGTVLDASIEYDYCYESVTFGVVWRDHHQDGEDWQ